MQTVTVTEASQRLSELLRSVHQGEQVLIVSQEHTVALLQAAPESERSSARRELLARLNQQTASGKRDWQRTELYED